jgi:alanine-glyoxylate transaminase / serine-glyoxylate transaminase / serine-pyruvate transaminase
MAQNAPRMPGRHFLQIPGPTPVPDRILHAISRPVIDHRGPEFAKLGQRVLEGLKTIFKTAGAVIIYPSSGTGAWEAALTNTLSPGDRVLMFESGQFATLWRNLAERLGLVPEFIASDWRNGADVAAIRARLAEDRNRQIKAVCIVHNETSTGCVSLIEEVRRAIDAVNHPALFMVDTISSLASIDYRHDEWRVDVTVAGSQKGLMLPPGLSFTATSQKALAASRTAKLPRAYFEWKDMLSNNERGFFPYTPATNLLYGLDVAIEMLHEEGLEAVFERHLRLGEATRLAVKAWGLDNLCRDPEHYSPTVTSVLVPEGYNADELRTIVLEHFNMSLGTGLNKVAGKVFRIGHLGDTNDLTILGALAGVEMGLELAGIPHKKGGVQAAMAFLADSARKEPRLARERI